MCNTCLVTQLLLLLLLNLGALNVELGFVVGCHEVEREALLNFKKSLVQLNDSLSSWEGLDCCHWQGVGCDNVTAYINRLDLGNPYIDPYDGVALHSFIVAPKVDPALLELKHLTYLDLSSNDFQASQIPGFIGSFKHLRYLDLSSSNFSGLVPFQIGNLSSLQNLDLSYNYYLSSDNRWASKLVSLQYLNMNFINITVSRNSMHELTMLPSLLGLRLSDCYLGNLHLSSLFSNSTWLSRIQQLDLSNNLLEGPIPHVFLNMTSLTYLSLHFNNFNGSIPLWMRNMTILEHLDLSSNSFSGVEGGAIMGILGNLCNLKTFDLSPIDLSPNLIGGSIGANHNFSNCASYALEILRLSDNMIGGTLPSWLGEFGNLRILDIQNNVIGGPIPLSVRSLLYLEELSLSMNNLTGSFPNCLGNLRALRILEAYRNRISGHIPTSIGNLSSLEKLDLSHNSLNGSIPESLGRCKSLVYIDLSSNSLQGVVSESHFANLSRLDRLDMSYNPLDLNFNPDWSPPFQMSEFVMISCKIRSLFPQWIGNQTNLYRLDLSDNMITGKLVQWFSSTQLYNINISHNQITGPVPYFSSSDLLSSVDLSYNMISGPLLHEGSSAKNDKVGTPMCQLLKLKFIDLQRNKIVGTIPDCWGNSDFLKYINLSFNNLSGNIPKSLVLHPNVAFLKLNNNSLQGPIPSTFNASSGMFSVLEILDLGENKLVGEIPISWNEKIFPFLRILRLRGNQLVGTIPPALCTFYALHSIDLAHNLLTGRIPRCFGHLIRMKSSIYEDGSSSYIDSQDEITTVVLKGAELQYTTTLQYVVNLDLSCNALVGSIPEEITNLSILIGLNLSHNHLTGNIPIKIGEMRSLMSLDLSNNNLSGTIPPSIADLTSVIALNLSYNKLDGQIPTGHQLQVIEDPSMAYIGNPGLCGDPLPNPCKTSNWEKQSQQEQHENDKEDIWEKPLFYSVIISGLATGFWGVVGSLLLKRRFRFALFHLVDNITDYFYVRVMIRLNRLRN